MKQFIVTLTFRRPPTFSTNVEAETEQAAIAEAKHWARECGYSGTVVDTSCRESGPND